MRPAKPWHRWRTRKGPMQRFLSPLSLNFCMLHFRKQGCGSRPGVPADPGMAPRQCCCCCRWRGYCYCASAAATPTVVHGPVSAGRAPTACAAAVPRRGHYMCPNTLPCA